ncbi:MAG: Zn-dependent alcohol dehydrogenase [Acidimicrobiales bacterium]|jgi:Zn-dependent alcohol dehydrogenase|nr:Zn-dependent alcohol dehydrogenase [Acidimicrobiales bacterium]
MRAAVLDAQGQPLTVHDDVEIDAPRAGEVRVRIAHCGVCHSDITIADAAVPFATPIVLGHEASGVVEEVGPGVTTVAVGDRVVLSPVPPCGRCYYCVRGEWNICVNSMQILTGTHLDGTTGLSRNGETVYRGLGVGAFGESVVVQETAAIPIGDDLPLDVACVLGCAVQTGVGAALYTAKVGPGDSVLVMGLGGVGLSIVQGAVLAGASTIIVSDPVAERREAGLRFGATHALDPTDTEVIAATYDLTGGIGADVAFDAVGNAALIDTGVQATRFGGTTVLVGAPPIDQGINIASAAVFGATEKKLVGCLLGGVNSVRDIPRFIELWRSGRLDLEGLITSRRPLAEVNDACDDLRAGRGIRTVLDL